MHRMLLSLLALVGADLRAMGHRLGPHGSGVMGGDQAIRIEHGNDGQAAGL